MPLVGVNQDANGVIDVVSINENGSNRNGLNGNGNGNANLTDKINEITNLPENRVSLNDLILNLASSGNDQHVKLASVLLDLDLIEGKSLENEKLGENCFDKISAKKDQKVESKTTENRSENEMDWTTVKSRTKRNRSGSNDRVNTSPDTSVSPHKSKNLEIMQLIWLKKLKNKMAL